MTECRDGEASSTPPPSRRVSITSLEKTFNDVACIDRCFLENATLCHVIYLATSLSAAHAVTKICMGEAICAFGLISIAWFWPPDGIHADLSFQSQKFKPLLDRYDIKLHPVPLRLHQNLHRASLRCDKVYIPLSSSSRLQFPCFSPCNPCCQDIRRFVWKRCRVFV